MNASKGFACIATLLVGVWVTGCSTPKSEPVYADIPAPSTAASFAEPPQAAAAPADQAPTAAAHPAASGEKPQVIVTPDNMLSGSVVSVNDVGRFAVLRFPLGRMPALGATLFVYHKGLKVGELKISGPQKDDHIVADIRTGECHAQDEVRDQ